MRASQQRVRSLVSLGALIVLAALLLYEVRASFRAVNLDISTYLGAASAVRHGSDPFAPVMAWITHYSGGQFQANYYVYAPFFAMLLIPLTFLPLHAAISLWAVANLLFLMGMVACSIRVAGRRTPLWALLLLTVGVSLLSPVRMELQWGQADIMLAFLVSACFLAARANLPVMSGVLLALAGIVKPPLLALVLLFLWKRQWRLAASAALGTAIFFFAPFAIVGGKALHEQTAIWGFWSSHYSPFIDNVSPKGVLARLLTDNPNGPGLVNNPTLATSLWIALVVVLGCVALATTSRRAGGEAHLSAIEFSLALCTVLLISPLTEWIYLTLLAIPLLLCASVLVPVNAVSDARVNAANGRPISGQTWVSPLGLALLCVYGALCLPLNQIEYHAWPGIAHGGIHGALSVLVAAVYLYPLLIVYGLSLLILKKRSDWALPYRFGPHSQRAIDRWLVRRTQSPPISRA